MTKAVIFVLLLLTSSAFIGVIVDQSITTNAITAGDERAQLMWGVIDLSVVIICLFHARQFVRIASQQIWILAFLAWSVLSVMWSDFPLLSLRRVAGLVCTMALGFLLGMRLEVKSLLRLVAWALAFTVPTSFVAAIFFPEFGVMHRLDAVGWRGVFNHKNALGGAMGIALIAFICLIWEERRNRFVWLTLLVPSVVLLGFSRSITAVVVTAVTLSIGFYLKWQLRPALKVAFYSVALLGALAVTLFLYGRTALVFQLIGRDPSLTGRIPLWHYSFDAILRRPFLGAGWDAFWPGTGGDKIKDLVRWNVPHAHNGFLELGLNIGVIGVVLFLICVWNCFRLAIRYSRDPSRPCRLWPLLFYTYLFFAAFAEAPSVDCHTLMFILFCALSVSVTEAPAREAIEYEPQVEEEYMPFAVASNSGMLQESP